jgi:hypothetical protein
MAGDATGVKTVRRRRMATWRARTPASVAAVRKSLSLPIRTAATAAAR